MYIIINSGKVEGKQSPGAACKSDQLPKSDAPNGRYSIIVMIDELPFYKHVKEAWECRFYM